MRPLRHLLGRPASPGQTVLAAALVLAVAALIGALIWFAGGVARDLSVVLNGWMQG